MKGEGLIENKERLLTTNQINLDTWKFIEKVHEPDEFESLQFETSITLDEEEKKRYFIRYPTPIAIADSFPYYVSYEIGEGGNIVSIRYEIDEISQIPRAITHLEHLKDLDLEIRGKPVFPDFITNISRLQSLRIWGTNESDYADFPLRIPSSVAKLQNLERLDLGDSHVHKLPNDICTLSKLREMNLSKNQIRALPENFGNLTQLRSIDLSENMLTTLPRSIMQLKQLEYLELSRNNFRWIPYWIGDLK
ncbi:MAG TPA: leucine-rich repeat domain-containing protein, partial [Patescibacteria group bacterium]|nr:leucine-rich repeat domain-containing protein [Patescibacteria group bacterium]